LVTSYKNEKAYQQTDEKYESIMKTISQNGQKYLNEVNREQFLHNLAGSEEKVVYLEK
jgi:hypothetical protein